MPNLLRHVLALLIAVSLIGGTVIPLALPAYALSSTQTTSSDPCEHMGMDQQSKQDHAMPCDSGPCKGAPWDCMQMCLASCAPFGVADNRSVVVQPHSRGAVLGWPADVSHTGLSIRPDPFPPKRLIA